MLFAIPLQNFTMVLGCVLMTSDDKHSYLRTSEYGRNSLAFNYSHHTMPRQRTSNLLKRMSTIRYEIAKDMTPEPIPLSAEHILLRNEILSNDGMCEYCGINRASGGWGDHFYPIIINKYPSEYCNDDWNKMPACSTCNAGKSGRTWREWFMSDSNTNPMTFLPSEQQDALLEKFTTYDMHMQRYCQRKNVDRDEFDRLMRQIEQTFKNVHDAIMGRNRVMACTDPVPIVINEPINVNG